MKKILLIVLCLALVGVIGCPNSSFLCTHKQAVQNVLNGIVVAANVLEASVPAASPMAEAAKLIVSDTQVALNQACPTMETAANLSNRLVQAENQAAAAGYVRVRR